MDRNDIISDIRRGLSDRRIARERHHGRRKVAQVRREYEELLARNPENVEELLCVEPRYKDRISSRRKCTKEIEEYITECYKQNLVKRGLGQSKQCKMAKDIYRELMEQGHEISYKTVCRYFHKLKEKTTSPAECFIKLGYIPGEKMEFDWGLVKIFINKELKSFNMGAVSLCSNARFAKLSTRQDTQAMMQMHVDGFRFFGYIPRIMVYDNMRTAVKRFVGGKGPTEALSRLMAFYGFRHRFCNVCKGNEKPHVERTVEVIRRWAFAGRDHFDSLDQANEYLREICIKANEQVAGALKEELENMMPVQYDMSCFVAETRKVDKLSTFSYDGNHYSVPYTYMKKEVWVKAFTDKLVVYDHEGVGTKQIATPERIYDKGKWSMHLDHFLEVLALKPQAIKNSIAMEQAPVELGDLYNRYFQDNGKSFAGMLIWGRDKGYTYMELSSAALICHKKGVTDISFEAIKSLLTEKKDVPSVMTSSSRDIEKGAIENLVTLGGMFSSATTERSIS